MPNGVVVTPGTVFTKIWRIRNIGSCTWPAGIRMVPVTSNFRSDNTEVIERRVRPGQSIDIGVTLVTPNRSGNFSGRFLLRVDRRVDVSNSTDDGTFNVRVVAESGAALIYDFIAKPCAANWKNGRDRTLACPGRRGTETGFVRQESRVELENGNVYSLALWTHPEMRDGGSISGTFPAILIQNGDRLVVRVGCIFGFTRCNVAYDVFIQPLNGNRTRLFPSQSKSYDGSLVTVFDGPIDTAELRNNYISFTLRVTALSHPQQAAAAWLTMELYR